LIQRFWETREEHGIHGGTRAAQRTSRNGARVNLWTLTSVSMADEFLRRHGVAVESKQGELFK
jgi:hypothetical protein